MSKYIDLDKAITVFDVRGRKHTTTVFQILDKNGAIYETADVVEQKHGKWIEYPECLQYDNAYSDDHIVCSECCHMWSLLDNCTETFNYCPNCGARMDGDS